MTSGSFVDLVLSQCDEGHTHDHRLHSPVIASIVGVGVLWEKFRHDRKNHPACRVALVLTDSRQINFGVEAPHNEGFQMRQGGCRAVRSDPRWVRGSQRTAANLPE